MIVIGFTGTSGAGKDTAANYLIDKKEFRHLSFKKEIEKEVEKRKLSVSRNSLIGVANEIRKTKGADYFAKILYKKALKGGKNTVVESFRNPKEIEAFRKHKNFYLIAIDADQHLRYKRILKRAGEKDKVSFAKFKKQEAFEMSPKNSFSQDLRRCMEMADFKLKNNGTIKELYKKIESILRKIN